MFPKTPIAWLCAALFASSASYAATPAAAPLDPVLGDSSSYTRTEARVAVMPVLGINDEDFPLEPLAAACALQGRVSHEPAIQSLPGPMPV